jgi:hypothetical protein
VTAKTTVITNDVGIRIFHSRDKREKFTVLSPRILRNP